MNERQIEQPEQAEILAEQSDSQTTNETTGASRGSGSYGQELLLFIWETIKIVIIALAIIIPVRYFVVQPFFVKGASMENTFHDGNYILIDEISYRFREPTRGDIIVFRFPLDTREYFIKRVIGLPGETIDIHDNHVTIYNGEHPQGFVLQEPYLSPSQVTLTIGGPVHQQLGPTEYFVMGDNRLRSSDSRSWGVLDRSFITGRVFFRAWPLNLFGPFPTIHYNTSVKP